MSPSGGYPCGKGAGWWTGKISTEFFWTGSQPGQVNEGNMSGIARLNGNAIAYKDPDSSITLKIKFVSVSRKAFVSHSGGDFGGLNVNPDGVYTKVSNRTPLESALEPE